MPYEGGVAGEPGSCLRSPVEDTAVIPSAQRQAAGRAGID